MDRYEIFDPQTYQPYGTADTIEDAVEHAKDVASGYWVVVDAEYGWTAAQGRTSYDLPSSAEPFETYALVNEHLRTEHKFCTMSFVDAGDPDFEGLTAWHNSLHLELDALAVVN